MKQFVIKKNEANQRFDKYLKKLLPEASSGFLYKMLRKKNITLNSKKAEGTELLQTNDEVQLFFSDETFQKFSGTFSQLSKEYDRLRGIPVKTLKILFENENYILLDKPVNMLSQKSAPEDISANELLISYMIHTGKLSEEEYRTFHPSVCNRLDRNTTGILVFGKTLHGLQEMSGLLKSRDAHKYYSAVVFGKMDGEGTVSAYLKKDEKSNTVQILKEMTDGASRITTRYRSVQFIEKCNATLVELELITGKTHQLRAHLSHLHHPIAGDPKYGNPMFNRQMKEQFGITSQLLHAERLSLPGLGEFRADLPESFLRLMASGRILNANKKR